MKSLLMKLVKLAVKYSGKAWKIADGKKTLAGGVITAIGVGAMFIPGCQGYSAELLMTGVPILITGLLHKYKKHKDRKEQQYARSN